MTYAQVLAGPRTLQIVQRAAPYLLAILLSLGLLAAAGGGTTFT